MTSEKQVCPHYDEDYICDCPFEPCAFFSQYICPPAEQIKENLFEAWSEGKREREEPDKELEELRELKELETLDELKAELERERCRGWNR